MITNVLLKLVLTPLIVTFCDLFSPYQINYDSTWECLVIGISAAIVNISLEWLFFTKGTYFITTLFDFATTLCVIYFGSTLFPAAFVSPYGALSITILVTVLEYFLHNWLWQHNWGTDLATK